MTQLIILVFPDENAILFSLVSPLSLSAEAGEAALRIPGLVLGRRGQQRRLQRLLRALLQLAQRWRGAPLHAADRGRGRSPEPLRQRQLVREEGGAAGPAEPVQEPEDAQVDEEEKLLKCWVLAVCVTLWFCLSAGWS